MTPVPRARGRARREPEPRRPGRLRASPVAFVLGLALLLVGACGAQTPASPAASSPPTGPPASGARPASGASPAASGAAAESPGPRATPWPADVVEAIQLLGKSDLEFTKASDDLTKAVTGQDLAAMYGAADGLATFIPKIQAQVDRIRSYPVTADLAHAYDAALPGMLAGATQLRDGVTANDPAAITAGSKALFDGLAALQPTRGLLVPLVEQAILMERTLVK